MSKASDNVFPRLLISEGGSTATPAAARVTIYAKADGLLYSKDDAGAETALGGGAGGDVATDAIWDAAGDLAVGTGPDTAAKLTKGADGTVLGMAGGAVGWAEMPGRLIGLTVYGTEGTGGGSFDCTSDTQADVSAANLSTTFVAPASGNILYRVTALMHHNATDKDGSIGIREATSNIITDEQVWYGQAGYIVISRTLYVTGVSAGSHTYKLAFSTNGATFSILYGNANGPITIEIIAAP